MGKYSEFGFKYADLDRFEAGRQAERDNLLWEQTQLLKDLQNESKTSFDDNDYHYTNSIPNYSTDLSDDVINLTDKEYNKLSKLEEKLDELKRNKQFFENCYMKSDPFIYGFAYLFFSSVIGIFVGAGTFSAFIGIATGIGCFTIFSIIRKLINNSINSKYEHMEENIDEVNRSIKKLKRLSQRRTKNKKVV